MITLQYLAGFIDGDGCISINARGPFIAVSNTNKKIILKISKEYSRFFYKMRIQPKGKNKPYYSARATGLKAIKLANLLEYYLILKKEQAHLIQKVVIIKGRNRISLKEKKRHLILMKKIQRINK